MDEESEMSKIRNMHWWTVEYGLVGSLNNPKIYGAGLLSSIGESKWCMSKRVKKLPYTSEVSNIGFDITKPQPQLFVTPDFAHLSFVLEEFANKMALRNGGLKGVEKLINSKDLGTIELSTGIQISGKFTEVIADENQRAVYIKTTGPTALAYKNKELIGHDKEYHKDGFGSPVGKLKGINIAIEDMSPTDLEAYGIYEGKSTKLVFERGIEVEGEIITGKRNLQGKIILISFRNCTVKMGDRVLFDPSWGVYDMAVGSFIISAFSGVADPNSYGLQFVPPKEKTHKIVYSPKEMELHKMYDTFSQMRDKEVIDLDKLEIVLQKLKSDHKQEWLLPLEIYELLKLRKKSTLFEDVGSHLDKLSQNKTIAHLIKDGMQLIG